MVEFFCVLCSQSSTVNLSTVQREGSSCRFCDSTVRQRTIAYLVNNLIRERGSERVTILGLSDHTLPASYLESLPGV